MRRYDLIPNLVETCKGYMAHERETLDAVIKARNQAAGAAQTASANPGNAAAMRGLQQADGALTGVLGRMFALAEAYPDLKANQNMLGLQEELTSTKTRFRLHARATTIRSWNTTPSAHPSLTTSSRVCTGSTRRNCCRQSNPPRSVKRCRSSFDELATLAKSP
jgi:LemA protein